MLNTRIKKIRKESGLTQDSFAERLSLTRNYISLMEKGDRIPSDRTISDICREFGYNEDWLRTGKGEPAIKRTRKQKIGAFVNEVMNLPDQNIQKRFIEALAKLNERDWETIAKIADNLKEGD